MADDFVLDRLNSFNAKVRRCSAALRRVARARRVCALKLPPRCVGPVRAARAAVSQHRDDGLVQRGLGHRWRQHHVQGERLLPPPPEPFVAARGRTSQAHAVAERARRRFSRALRSSHTRMPRAPSSVRRRAALTEHKMQRSCRATPRRARTGAHAGLSLSSNVPELWSVPFTHASLSPARAYATACVRSRHWSAGAVLHVHARRREDLHGPAADGALHARSMRRTARAADARVLSLSCVPIPRRRSKCRCT